MKRAPGSVITTEDLDSALDDLLALATKEGERLRGLSIRNRVATSSPRKPDISGLLRDRLRTSLEDELVPAPKAEEGEINSSEVEHELMKKALIGLKLSALRELAKERGVPSSGVAEEVASRVARAYEWDPERVAKLVIAHEDEPTPERGHTSRIFPIRDGIDLANAHERLRVVAGRYVRVGVARWFVFDSIKRDDPSTIDVTGTYRAYRAAVDEVDGEASLRPVPEKQQVHIRVAEGSTVEVLGATTQAARAAARALEIAVGVELRGYVPFADVRSTGVPGGIHPVSDFMLDLLETRFRAESLTKLNLIVARFKVSDEETETPEGVIAKPALRAVRFEGTHLLDSIAACRLLAHDGRPLVDIVLRMSHKQVENDEEGRFPVKTTLESDHVLVATGFGSVPEGSLLAHRAVVRAVMQEVDEGVADREKLEVFVNKIRARAAETEAPTTATMLLHDED
ncbi:hypothetical protein [Knoellia sp. p5-6-4]|uniref:hypothetical protein n=1 Tax=unclassified Knoellia TaxID=2618719 RepID=UPI0023DA63AD|nr:hypothetical protein [Knoellia sp. p5-6-4]MDF2146757.1 hypothetical protein [Knoellia sp. p5-6-4]